MGMIKKYIYPTRVVKTYGDIAGADELKREKDHHHVYGRG